jgi:hypothetical protein
MRNRMSYATHYNVMPPPMQRYRNAATFGDHQRVFKVSYTRRRAVGLGRCPVRAQGSKVRFADDAGIIAEYCGVSRY